MNRGKKSGSSSKRNSTVRSSIDLHGKTVEEAEQLIDQFLHRLSSFENGRARIVVGKGTGAIRAFVTAYVRRAGYPFEFEMMPNGQRNDGVLILFLD